MSHSVDAPWVHCLLNFILQSIPGTTDCCSCVSLFTVICGISHHTGAGSGMCSTPPQRTSDHLCLFSLSGDHKAVARVCEKCSIVLSAPLVCWLLSLSFTFFVALHPVVDPSVSTPPSVSLFRVQERTACASGRCRNAGSQHLWA